MAGPGFVIRTERDRVLAAAVRVVAHRGHAAASVDEFAAEAFLPVDEVLALVGDKEECFLAAFSASTRRAYTAVLERFERDGPWPARVRDALAAFLEMLAAEPDRLATTSCPADRKWPYHAEGVFTTGATIVYDDSVPCRS